jgi:hypothetical protein
VAPPIATQPFPFASQRSHWYVNEIGAVPVQAPAVTLIVFPTAALPTIAGDAVLRGVVALPPTTAVGADSAVAVPALFFAVTATRSRPPVSFDETRYVLEVASLIVEQLFPFASQRSQA